VRAQRCTKASQFTRLLLLGVFDHKILLESSLKGGSSKKDNAPARKPLDENKLNAIYSKLTVVLKSLFAYHVHMLAMLFALNLHARHADMHTNVK
jgi:hypothetical protein